MKRVSFSIILVIMFIVIGSSASAQPDNKLVCVALVKKDSVVLRWVPESIPVWQVGIKYGYVVKRFTIAKGGVFLPDGLSQGELLTKVPIRPFGKEVFDTLALSDRRINVVQEAIFSTEFQPPAEGDNFLKFKKAYDELQVSFGFALFICDLSPVIATAAGLQFTDRNVLPDERYAYSISLANIPDGLAIDPAVVVLDAGLISKLPPVTDIQAIFLDKSVKFQWPINLNRGTYTAYILEKSTDGVSYASVSDLPLVNLTEDDNPDYFVYTDSLKSNYQQTWYKVKGISPFGEEGPASEVVMGKGTPEFKAYAVIDTAEVIENSRIIVRWRITKSESVLITGISILRSDRSDGVFENLTSRPMSPGMRIFTDKKPGISNYYKIMLSGKDNLTSLSFPYLVQTEDNDPPAAPEMLSGTIDSTGYVIIAWKENTDPDLLGYKVFRANDPDEEFISLEREISSKNVCRDTINLKTLTQKIYYQVVAIDKRYNTSAYSAILQLSRPDTISPAPALISRIDVVKGKVTINLEGSPSNDISMYELYRIMENDTVPERLKTWKSDLPITYNDTPIESGISYCYVIETFDLAGNRSEFSRKIYVPNSSQSIINLRAEQNRNGKSIMLSWDIPKGFLKGKTIIYRCKVNEPLSIYVTTEAADQMFEDTDIELNMAYNYRIKVFSKNGSEIVSSVQISVSPFSNSISETK